jgi:hypothetical protein
MVSGEVVPPEVHERALALEFHPRLTPPRFCHTSLGSTARNATWRAVTAVTAQGKHHPLQWNMGSVHRYTDSGVIPATITSPSALRKAPR